jgi:hypothetical protein
MPKAAPTKRATKKAAPKKAAPKKAVARKTVSPKASSWWSRSFLVREQEEFHKNHPNAEILILIFLLTFSGLAMMYLYRFY